jgi:hypothetical protein
MRESSYTMTTSSPACGPAAPAAPGYPDAGPHAGHTLATARRALRRSRGRRALTGVAAVVAAVVGLTAVGPIEPPSFGTFGTPGGHDNSLPSQGDPPGYPRQRLLHDVANLERQARPAAEDSADRLSRSLPRADGRHDRAARATTCRRT